MRPRPRTLLISLGGLCGSSISSAHCLPASDPTVRSLSVLVSSFLRECVNRNTTRTAVHRSRAASSYVPCLPRADQTRHPFSSGAGRDFHFLGKLQGGDSLTGRLSGADGGEPFVHP